MLRRRKSTGRFDARSCRPDVAPACCGGSLPGFLPYRTARLTNAKHRWQWERGFELHAVVLWQRKLNTITREDVLAVLRPIWDKHHVTAQRIRGRLEDLFDHAIQNDVYHGDNPARWSLFNATLSAPRKMEGMTDARSCSCPLARWRQPSSIGYESGT